jgi:hypothetical protein
MLHRFLWTGRQRHVRPIGSRLLVGHYEPKKADGNAPMEAMRCVRRRLSDIVVHTMLNDAVRTHQAEVTKGTWRLPRLIRMTRG